MSCVKQEPLVSTSLKTHVIINSRNQEFVDEMSAWCARLDIPFDITKSNGTPSRGKNEAVRYFRRSSHDGMVMLDGDDLMYPVAAKQIERHVAHHTGTDLLIVKPSDQVQSYEQEGAAKVSDDQYAICWGTNTCKMRYEYGPGVHPMWQDKTAARNLGGHVYYSRKTADMLEYDEEQLLGEDLLFEFEAFKLHLEGKLSFWLSFASDVQLLDRTNDNGGIQQQNNGENGSIYYDRLVSKVSSFLNPDRSSFEELPIEFPDMMLNWHGKIDFIKRFF
jgi:hypothetical protein